MSEALRNMQEEFENDYLDCDANDLAEIDIKSIEPQNISDFEQEMTATYGDSIQQMNRIYAVNGLNPDGDFIKDDKQKSMLSLIEPAFILSLGAILTFGAKKYSIDNWKLCTDTQRYKDALLRHTYAYLSGELIDEDSGIEHTACMAFNTMALQWFDKNLKEQK